MALEVRPLRDSPRHSLLYLRLPKKSAMTSLALPARQRLCLASATSGHGGALAGQEKQEGDLS